MKPIVDIHCSKLARPMTCAGSLRFENLSEPEAGEAAREGTACGELLERMLTNQPLGTAAKNGVAFDEDMHFYAGSVHKLIKGRALDGKVFCEVPIDWATQSGITIAGKYDACSIGIDGKLYIDDLKYGWGIVDVFENWQLLGYAIGALKRMTFRPASVVLTIHQPRPHHEDGPTRSWELSIEQVNEYEKRIQERLLSIAHGNRELVTGSQCKYCPAASNGACPAFNRALYNGIDVILSDFKQDSLNNLDIAFQLKQLERVKDILKIKQDSLDMLALTRIKAGEIIPGYVTKESYGDRTWRPGVNAKVIETLTGVKVTKESMLSPAQAEIAGVPKALVKDLVERFFKGVKIVPGNNNTYGDKVFGKEAPNVATTKTP